VSIGDRGLATRDAADETRDETRIEGLTFAEAGSSQEAARWYSANRSREYRRRRKMDLMVRTVRIREYTVRRLIALGYLERGGDKKAEGIAIEAYLGDTL
jgi:hypothetical protein